MGNQEKDTKTLSITLNAEDQGYIDRIAKEFGLIKMTDCLRLALRLATKQIEFPAMVSGGTIQKGASK